MTIKTLSSTEAKRHFRVSASTVQKEPVAITRKGKAVAIALSPEDFRLFLDGKEIEEFQKNTNKTI